MSSKFKLSLFVVLLASSVFLSGCNSVETVETSENDSETQEAEENMEIQEKVAETEHGYTLSTYVLMEKTPGYTTFTGIDESLLEEAKKRVKELEKAIKEMESEVFGKGISVELLTMQEFKKEENEDRLFNDAILINDYANLYEEADIIEELKRAIEHNPTGTFSLTFSGGIAFTLNDHDHTLNLYVMYIDDPEDYSVQQAKLTERWDPILPTHHTRSQYLQGDLKAIENGYEPQEVEENIEKEEVAETKHNYELSTHVIVDSIGPYATFMGVDEANLEMAKENITKYESDVELMTIEEFKSEENEKRLFSDVILINDYAQLYEEADIFEEIKYAVEHNPTGPFSLTFSGGIAFTANDHAHARKIYQMYLDDPEGYSAEQKKLTERWDPILPTHHTRSQYLQGDLKAMNYQ